MQERLYDLFTCFKLSLKIFVPVAIVGAIVGVIVSALGNGVNAYDVLTWIFTVGTWLNCLALLVCAIAFMRPKFLGDLDYQKQWRVHFYKMNLIGVMFVICSLMFVYLAGVDCIRFYFFS